MVLEPILAALVVLLTQTLVAEYLVRLADALELLVRFWIVRILIRV